MKKLAIVLTFVFAAALITPTFAEEGKKTVAKAGTTAEKGCAKECAKTCTEKEAKACCAKEAKPATAPATNKK